jgi:streptogramin lyase
MNRSRLAGMSGARFLAVAVAALALVFAGGGAPAWALPFTLGDVFVSVSNGKVQEFTPLGALVQTLDTGAGGFTTGSAFDSSQRLNVTNFSNNQIYRFDNTGASLGVFVNGGASNESIVFDAAGNFYVGRAGTNTIQKFDSAGIPIQTSIVLTTSRGTDWIDLAADQHTLFYTSESAFIGRWDSTSNTQLANFVTGDGLGVAYALRILPDGSVLVANSGDIRLYDSTGAFVRSYDTGANDSWFALNLDPDGVTFWSADFGTANVCRFVIATGALVNCFNTGTGGGTVFGLSVFGEITQGCPECGGGRVPEPATLLLLGSGLFATVYLTRRGTRSRSSRV